MYTIGGRAHTIDEIVDVCRLGYPFVEINFNDPDKIESQMATLLEIKQKYSVTFLAHFPNEGNPSDLEQLEKVFIPKIKRLVELCPKLGIRKGTIHFWMDQRMDWSTDQIISAKISMLSTMAEYATEYGVTLCLENLSCKYDSFAFFFSEIPLLRMTMDIGHGQLLTTENTAFGFMAHVFDKIDHIHVHDNLGGDKVTDDLHLPLGQGIIDYPRIFTTLKDKAYASTISMEVSPDKMKHTEALINKYLS